MGTDRFAQLHHALEDCLANPVQSRSHLANLQRELERARPAFLKLLDTPPKDAAQRALFIAKGHFRAIRKRGCTLT